MTGLFKFALIIPPDFKSLTEPPTYTDIYNETVGKQGDLSVSLDPNLNDAGKVLDDFNVDGNFGFPHPGGAASGPATGCKPSSAQPGAPSPVPPDPILTSAQDALGAMDLTQLDAHVAAYDASVPVGAGIVTEAQALSAPTIGPLDTMWVYPGTSQPPPPGGPGEQVPGQITAGDPPFVWTVTFIAYSVGSHGVSSVYLAQTSDVFTGVSLVSATPTMAVPGGGIAPVPSYEVTLHVNVNPHAAGNFSDTVILNADYPRLAGKYPHRIALQVQPHP